MTPHIKGNTVTYCQGDNLKVLMAHSTYISQFTIITFYWSINVKMYVNAKTYPLLYSMYIILYLSMYVIITYKHLNATFICVDLAAKGHGNTQAIITEAQSLVHQVFINFVCKE